MPRPKNPRIQTDPASKEGVSTVAAASPSTLSPDQVRRWGALIAEGRDEVPTDLPDDDRERLQSEVRLQLRDQMVRLVARAVASNLYREFGRKKVEDASHDRA